MNTVIFDPYKGKSYGKGPLLKGKRILVVGASHYCGCFDVKCGCGRDCCKYGKYSVTSVAGEEFVFGEGCKLFTKVVIGRYLNDARLSDKKANGYFRTFTKFCNTFFPKGVAKMENRAALLAELAHMEYVQGAEGKDPKVNDRTLFNDERNYRELRSAIRKLRPDIVIVWGNRVWLKIMEKMSPEVVCEDVAMARVSDCEFFLVRSYHPSASRFDRDRLRTALAKAGLILETGSNV